MRDLYDECSWCLEDVVTREAGRGERAPRDLTGDEVEEGGICLRVRSSVRFWAAFLLLQFCGRLLGIGAWKGYF